MAEPVIEYKKEGDRWRVFLHLSKRQGDIIDGGLIDELPAPGDDSGGVFISDEDLGINHYEGR